MPETIPPRTNLEREIVRIWEQVLQRAPIGVRENFFDLGGTSLDAVRIFKQIEELVHQRLPLSLILGYPTIEQLAESLLPGRVRDRKVFVFPIQPAGTKPNFFCIGEGVLWRPLAEQLGTDQPVINVGLDPRATEQMREPKPLEKLARDMVSAICEKQPQGPYYLGGFCSEGVFAYEVARQLKLYGHEIGLLVLVEPAAPRENAFRQFAKSLRRFIFRTGFRFRELCGQGLREFPQYARDRWGGVLRMLKDVSWRNAARSQVLEKNAGSPSMEQIVFVAANSYRPKPLECPTVIFRSKDWPMFSAGDPYFGWRNLLTGPSRTIEVPGDHISMFREPVVAAFAEKVKACLANTKPTETSGFDIILDVEQSPSPSQTRAQISEYLNSAKGAS
jgi:thioesterase domain-containing protein